MGVKQFQGNDGEVYIVHVEEGFDKTLAGTDARNPGKDKYYLDGVLLEDNQSTMAQLKLKLPGGKLLLEEIK